METRIFKTLVTMPCTFGDYRDHLQSKLTELGYNHLQWSTGKGTSMKVLMINIAPGKVSWSAHADAGEHTEGIENQVNLDKFNAELFMALAAMSAGEKFWRGEFIVVKPGEDAPGSCLTEGSIHKFERYDDQGMVLLGVSWHSIRFRKATEAELIAHFTPITDVVFEEPEPKKWVPEFRELVQGLVENATIPIYGYYLATSSNGVFHYIKGEMSGAVYECIEIRPHVRVSVTVPDLIACYAKVNNLDINQIVVSK